MSEEQLEPCPKCGAHVKIKRAHGCKYVFCDNCETQSARYHEKYDDGLIVIKWNKRPVEDALRKRVEDLEAENKKLKEENNELEAEATANCI